MVAGIAAAFVLALCCSGGAAPAATGGSSFAAGTLIVPMDTDASGNHAAFNQNAGMWRAYGLVYRLLQNDIPVSWGIDEAKTGIDDVDVSVSSVHDLRTGTDLGSWDYRGGPFIVAAADAAAAEPVIRAWWAANANQPNVHVAQAEFTADVNVTLRKAPRIAQDTVNANISMAYFNAAGIPDSNGRPWSTSSPNVLTEAQIAGGALFEQGTGCPQRRYDTFVTPHNGGYSYSLTDPTNLGTKAYAALDDFVHDGGGWTALCHSILSNENAIADLTRNGSAAVRSLFKTSLEGGDPGGFLTRTGFPKIDNVGGTWAVHPGAADLPIAQLVRTSAAQSLPGGSVQTWPAPGNPGAPTYWAHTERVASFTANGIDHDQIISGTYHDGTGSGKLTFIGGHSFSTSLPYSGNTQGPYVRAFYNSLLFNGAAVAKLDLTTSPSTFPQNGTGLLSVSIANTGGSVATDTHDVGITLAPGFTYVSTAVGPEPMVDGQHLVWSSLGDVAGGATPVTIQVAVDPSVSGTTGAKQLATFHAVYGDVFGEGFTADVCRDITITPVPAPTLTKSPAEQGPFTPGTPVTWTLDYGNTGSAALENAVLQETLPKGFAFVSSTPAATTVIPAASGTIVRFAVGTIAGGTPAAGTVTLTARAGAVTAGEGTPPHQTFSNQAALTGTDAAGTPFDASATADVTVQALDITLGKSVDKTSLTDLPDSVTYTLTPASSTSGLLSNVRVIDPYPAGLTAPPGAISAGGTYGAYVPVDGEPGDDPGPPHLTSAFTVDPGVVTQGEPVTVTLRLTSSANVTGVSPNELGVSGGAADCTGPTPASAAVGAAATSFTWSCTLEDAGEYVFTGSGGDAAGTYAWPTASSASVLSAGGGGPNVVAWNLGGTTAAVPGETITSGTTAGVFAFRGAGNTNFQRYDTTSGGWGASAAAPAKVNPGGALTTDGKTVWGMSGDGKQAFWAYDVATNTWTAKASTGVNVKAGGALQYLDGYVYALMGNGTTGFRRYDVAANTWAARAPTPANVKEGGALTTDGTYLYALQGNGTGAANGFWRYDPATNMWTALAVAPGPVKWGASLTRIGNFIYALEGGGKNLFWRYDLSAGTWTTLANTPANVADGGALATDGTNVYAFQGKTKAFWLYDVAHNTWTRLADFPPGNVGQGGALVYVPGNDPHGRFTSLSASRSLVGDGDSITVTFTLRSTDPIAGVDPGTLVTTPTGGASCSGLTGPRLMSADDDISGFDDPVTYEWTCEVAAGATPGSLVFSDTTATGTAAGGTITFPVATSNSALVTPALTFTATVPAGTEGPIVDQALLIASGQAAGSGPVSTFVGKPELTIVKSSSPGPETPLVPGDPIRYTMVVENTGVATATNVVVTDAVPDRTVYTSCSGGASCDEHDGTVTWQVGSLGPGETATVAFEVAASTTEQISDTPYAISNTASATSTETPEPAESNTVTNELTVRPELVKAASEREAAPGAAVTYTLTVTNPGAAFTADVTDPLPAGTELTGNCDPASCTDEFGGVTWTGVTIDHGTTTFSFEVRVTAGGGSTLTDTATLTPTSPNLAPIDSNEVQTDVGPELAVVKLNDPTGQVSNGETITYTLVVSNESSVTAHDVAVTDPLPPGTTFGTCTTPDGTLCTESARLVTWDLGDVPGGASVTVTFTVTVGTPPAGTFQLTNQAQVTASNTSQAATSNIVTNALPFPDLLLKKTPSAATYAAVGDVIDYAYVISNNSTTSTLQGPVTVADDKVAVSCPEGDVAPLAAITCTGRHTITQADLDAGSIVNTATAHAEGAESNAAEATVSAERHPALHLTKSIASGDGYSVVGDTISYRYVVTNTGNVTIDQVAVHDETVNGVPSCPDDPLGPGESITCTAVYTVTQDDLDAGELVDHATATGGGATSNTATATAQADPTAAVSLAKTSDATDATTAGDTITYTFTVENTGTVTITAFGVTDPLPGLSAIDCPDVTSLAPGASAECTATYTVTQADVDTGAIENTATVDGSTESAGPVTADATLTTDLSQTASVQIEKRSDATGSTGAGDEITYRYRVENTGSVTITSFHVTDELDGLSAIDCDGVTSLAPGASAECTATYTVTQGDVDRGSITNTASVDGQTANAGPVHDHDTLVTSLTQGPELTLEKTGVVDTGMVEPTGRADAGDRVEYTLTARNTGNTTLTGVEIRDSKLGALECTQPARLSPGATLVCTGSYTLTQDDIDAGSVTNTASVDSDQASASASGDVDIARDPELALDKHDTLDTTVVAPADRADAGDEIRYTLTATNAGNVTLTGVRIVDPALGSLNCNLDQPAELAPRAQLICTATRTLTQGDVDAGLVENTATATSNESPPADATNEVGLTRDPALALVKRGVLDTDVPTAGDRITYTLTATNTGNTTLTGVGISDPSLGTLTCSPAQPAVLAPGNQLRCTASHALTQAEIDAGVVDNRATASSGETAPAEVTQSVPVPRAPLLTLLKEDTTDPTAEPPVDRVDAGDRILYTLTATNAGNTTLHGVTITDPALGTLSCTQPATLAPGEQLTCTGTRTLTQTQIDTGHADNTATADSTETTPVTATNEVPLPQTPGLTLTKQATLDPTIIAPTGRADAGDHIDYRLVATNAGNTTLTGVTITDPALGTLSCTQPATLAPGHELVCTATHTLTQTDIQNGHRPNTATTDSTQTPPTTATNDTTITKLPALALAKHAVLGAGVPKQGDRVRYTLTATNVGNTILTGVSIADPAVGALDCTPDQPARLDPGEHLVCTGSHTLTQADIDAGHLDNTATADSAETPARSVSRRVRLPQAPGLTLLKTGVLDTSVSGPTDRADAGDQVHYTLTATNAGNVTLTGVTITDPTLGTLTCTQPATLAPGAQLVCTGTYTLTQDDVDADHVTNTATATSDRTRTVDSTARVPITQAPALTLTKHDTLDTTVVAPADRVDAGDAVTYILEAANAGNTKLTGVTVSDPKLPGLICTPDVPLTLAPGGKVVCTGTYEITQADLDAGKVGNVAVADSGQTQSTREPNQVGLARDPALALAKTGTLDGNRVDYALTATNTGNVTLTGVAVDDPTLRPLVCAPPQPLSLAPGEQLVCAGSRAVTDTDLAAGHITNTASAHSDQTEPSRTSETVPLPPPPRPALSLVKRADRTSFDRVGAVIRYTYLVSNTGNTALAGPVTVSDDRSRVTCPDGGLAPGATTTCRATYTVTQADLDAGAVTNTATARTEETTSNASSTSVGAVQVRSLNLVKSAVPETFAAAGDIVHYSYVVTNTGNVGLPGPVTVSDTLARVTCPGGGLAPGASTTCEATYTITRADLDAGSVTNAATAHANGTDSNRTQATVTVPITHPPLIPSPPRPSLRVTKTPVSQQVAAGGRATFTIRVTNTGNVALTRVAVSDARAPGCARTSATLAALGSLAPGESVTYRCALADVRRAFTNVASARGIGPLGVPVTASGRARVTVRSGLEQGPLQRPALTIVKGPRLQTMESGGAARFAITVRNTGSVVLRDVRVSDPRVPGCARRFAYLAVGLSTTYRCRANGVTASFRNVATVTAQRPSGARVRASSTQAVVRVAAQSIRQVAAIALLKAPGLQTVAPGHVARFQVTARNAGNSELRDVRVSDPLVPACDRTIARLAAGASLTYGCASGATARSFTNLTSVTALSAAGLGVVASDYAAVSVLGAPAPPALPGAPPFTG